VIAASGILLAGGHSRRFGRDKLQLVLDGETLLERTTRVVSEVAEEVFVTGLPTGHAAPPGSIALGDARGGTGPAAGLVAGLQAIHAARAVVVACDLPYLKPDLLRFLLGVLGPADAAVPVVDGHRQVACAAYSATALPAAERLLAAARRPLRALLDDLHVRWVSEEELQEAGLDTAAFTNINTPDDWERVALNHATRS
jgi:molybdopterin-guanine dinucleotide biosynthesis protein A